MSKAAISNVDSKWPLLKLERKKESEGMRTIPLEVDTFKNESVAFGGIFVCQRIQRSQNFNY